MEKIALDLGYWSLIGKYGDKMVEFPTQACFAQGGLSLGFSNRNGVVEIDKGQYFVGYDALAQTKRDLLKPFGDNWFETDTYKLFVLYSIAKLVKSDCTVHLATGLPLKQLKSTDDGEKLKKILIDEHWVRYNGHQYNITIADVSVFPQGVNVYRHLISEDGTVPSGQIVNGVSLKGRLVAGIDAGSNNTQMYTLVMPKTFRWSQCGTFDYGYWNLLETLTIMVNNELKRNYSPIQLVEAERTGVFLMGVEKIDISAFVEQARNQYINTLLDKFSRTWKQEDIDEMALFTVSGGGAYILQEHLRQIFPATYVTSTPHLDNVEHYHRRIIRG